MPREPELTAPRDRRDGAIAVVISPGITQHVDPGPRAGALTAATFASESPGTDDHHSPSQAPRPRSEHCAAASTARIGVARELGARIIRGGQRRVSAAILLDESPRACVLAFSNCYGLESDDLAPRDHELSREVVDRRRRRVMCVIRS